MNKGAVQDIFYIMCVTQNPMQQFQFRFLRQKGANTG